MGRALDDAARLLHFGQFQRGGTGDVDENSARSVDCAGLEQRRRDGFLRGVGGAMRPARSGSAHDGITHARHDGFYVGKVAIDDPGDGDDVRDALHALPQDVISHAE